ncbi:hypothetical protein ACJMK2_016136 [Sinanodonta woodiana]|uniref:Chitin-binding type-2 domain-containing protein n=1 Tax=Sinanodonta woodiana TaxID=1069815 RepID=A0ABD3UTM6_SINWO
MANQFYFDDTCVPVYKANCSETYINPCDCRKYYQCERNQYLLIPRDCGQSSAYDQDLKICNHENKIIYSGKCNLTAPWGRCNASDERKQWLQGFCTNATLLPTSTTQGTSVKSPASKNEDNTGLIVGLVIALFIIVFIAAGLGIFWMYRRKKRSERENKSTLSQMANPQYFAETDEDYMEIDDSMHNPTYNTGSTLRPSLPARPEYQTANGTLQTNTQGNDFVYDNQAFRDETGISQSLEAAAEITGKTRPYMTLEHVNNIAQGYDQISAVGSPRYTSEITTLGQAFADSFNKAGEEGVTQTISEGVSSLETDRENDVTAERTTGNEQG